MFGQASDGIANAFDDTREPFANWILVSYGVLFVILLMFATSFIAKVDNQYLLTWLVGVIGCLTGFVNTVYRKQYLYESRKMIAHFDIRIKDIINKIDNNK